MRDTPLADNGSEPRRTGRTILKAGGAVDAMGTTCSPAALLLEDDCIVACDAPEAIGHVADARVVELHDQVLLTEGSPVEDPNRLARRMTSLLQQACAAEVTAQG